MKVKTKRYFVKDDGIFPNNSLPILFYPKVLDLPKLFPALSIRKLFRKNNWTNNWKQGIFWFRGFSSFKISFNATLPNKRPMNARLYFFFPTNISSKRVQCCNIWYISIFPHCARLFSLSELILLINSPLVVWSNIVFMLP